VSYCANCGAGLWPEAKFCASCGQAVATAPRPRSAHAPAARDVVTSRKENPVTQGMKLGTTGCVGCLTMVVLFLVVVALLVHH
jgi:hypothetical protein